MHLSSHCFCNNISFNQLAVWWFMQEFDQTTSGNFSLRFSPIDFQLYIYNIFLVAYYYTDRIRLFSGDFEFSLSILYMDFSILSRILIAFFLYFCLPFCTYYSFSICWFFKIGFLYMQYLLSGTFSVGRIASNTEILLPLSPECWE